MDYEVILSNIISSYHNLSIALVTSRKATLSEMIVSNCDFTAEQRKEIFKKIQKLR
jgi:hypothetical protein